jgi:RHS repeat-associated protein
MPIATYTGSKHYAVHTDHLNTPRRLTQSNKQVAWQWAFSAFGDEQPTTAKNRFVDPASTPNAGSTTVADVTFNLRYPGQYFDRESNLHYNWMRSYRSQDGRYTQADPIDLQGGWNKFAYAEQNPLSITDPMGLMGNGPTGGRRAPITPGPSPVGINVTIGGGGSFHAPSTQFPFGAGFAIDGGLAFDTNGNTCFYSNICTTEGPGFSGSAGPVGAVGSGLITSGSTQYSGVCWSGGTGMGGSGSVLFGNDGSIVAGRGLAGPAAGASVTYQNCTLRLLCRK